MTTLFLSSLLIFAQQKGGGPAGFLGSPLFMILLMFAVFYLIVIRPQNTRRKELETRVGAAEKGDRVVTTGGLHGTIHQINEKTITLKGGGDNVYLTFEKTAIASVSGKRDASKTTKKDDSDKKESDSKDSAK